MPESERAKTLNGAGELNELSGWLARPLSSGARGFAEGASAAWRGARFLGRRRWLWKYALAPVALNVLVTAILLAGLIAAAVWFFSTAHPWFAERRSADGFLWWAAELALAVLLLIGCLASALVIWKLLAGVLCGYFYNKLAEQVERQLGVAPGELKSLSWRHEFADTLLNLGALAAVNLVLLAIGLVPVVGSVIALIGGFYCNCFLMGLDSMATPVALRGERRLAQFRYARRRASQTVGLGAVSLVLQFTPIVGAIFLTTAVVGGVLLHRRSLASSAAS